MSLSVKTRDGKLWGTDDKGYLQKCVLFSCCCGGSSGKPPKPPKPPKHMYNLREGHGDLLPFAKSFHFASISQ